VLEPTDPYVLRVNGADHQVTDSWMGASLLSVLREHLGLWAAKGACEQGECGSCSVLVDGALVCSCLVLAAAAPGKEIVTIEGLGSADGPATNSTAESLSVVQQAFVDAGAVQCGFCTPGLVAAVEDLLSREAAPTEILVREALSGNICRCTGYGRILAAVEKAVELKRTDRAGVQ
jgi:carbon-monoxide dehydrogenase small subunit